jgi:hypothetical protein
MATSDPDSDPTRAVYNGVGECIMAWAQAENQLMDIWRIASGRDSSFALTVWDRLKSFDAKLQILNSVMQKHPDTQIKSDWTLLNAEVSSCYKKRNRVAHSTMVAKVERIADEEEVVAWGVAPFFSQLNGPTTALSADDLKKQTAHIIFVSGALEWLKKLVELDLPSLQRRRSEAPAHDLLLQLRMKDARMREAQRHRALAWRQYLQRNPNLKLD